MEKKLRPPRKALENLVPYDAKEVKAEVLLASNENPLNMPEEVMQRIKEHLHQFQFNRYPEASAPRLCKMIAEANGLESESVIIGNGGDEIIMNLFLTWGGFGRKVLSFPPTFAMYEKDAAITETELVEIPRDENFNIDSAKALERVKQGDIDLIFLANPNNPTGNITDENFIIELLESTDALVCVDEAYFEFSRMTIRPHLERYPNLVILRTFSKAFSLAGLRIGYLLASPEVIREMRKVRQPYSVSSFSQWAAQIVYRNRMSFESAISEIVQNREALKAELEKIPGVEVFESEANYLMFRVVNASILWRDLLKTHGVHIRDLTRAPGLEDCLRVTIGSPEQNEAFLQAMQDIVKNRQSCDREKE